MLIVRPCMKDELNGIQNCGLIASQICGVVGYICTTGSTRSCVKVNSFKEMFSFKIMNSQNQNLLSIIGFDTVIMNVVSHLRCPKKRKWTLF